jgi:hypothetical protein
VRGTADRDDVQHGRQAAFLGDKRQRTHALIRPDQAERVVEQPVGAPVDKRDPVAAACRPRRRLGFEPGIRHEHCAGPGDRTGSEADARQRLHGGSRPLESEAGGDEGRPRQMRPQAVELCNDCGVEFAKPVIALSAEDDRVAGRQVDRGSDTAPETIREEIVGV